MKKLIIILILCCIDSLSFAAPGNISTSGTYATGSTVTISGTGFLTKSPAAPLLWAPFSTSIQPSSLGRLTAWSSQGGASCEVWESNIGSPGGGVRTNPTSCINNSSYPMALYANFSGLGVQLNSLNAKFYMHRKRNPTERKIGDGTNIKSVLLEHYNNYGDGEVLLEESSSPIWKGQNMSPSSYFYTDAPDLNSWSSEEIIAQVANSINQNAALFSYYINGSLAGSTTQGKTIALNSGNVIDTAALVYHGHYSSSGAQDLEYFDDVYVDNTWSRVMLGNANTFAGSTHREIVIPTAWSDTSITVSFNQGTFTNGQTAYLYVFDSTGAVNSTGYAIEIEGEAGDTTAPTTTISTSDPSTISSDSLTVVGSASDAVGVSGCKWRIGAAPSASFGTGCTGTTSFSCSTSGYSSGSNTAYVGCYDAAGNYGPDSITVNYTPSVSSTVLTGSTTGTVR